MVEFPLNLIKIIIFLEFKFQLANYEKIKVILVDDHELVRMGFRLLLEGANNLEVIAEFFWRGSG